jgi:hypothetical protein
VWSILSYLNSDPKLTSSTSHPLGKDYKNIFKAFLVASIGAHLFILIEPDLSMTKMNLIGLWSKVDSTTSSMSSPLVGMSLALL